MLAADVVGHSSQPVVTDVALWFVQLAWMLGWLAVVPLFPPVYSSPPASLYSILSFKTIDLYPPRIYSSLFYRAVYRSSFLVIILVLHPRLSSETRSSSLRFFPQPCPQPSSRLPCNSSSPQGQSSRLLSTGCRLSTRLSALLWFPSANTVNSYWPVCRHVITLN